MDLDHYRFITEQGTREMTHKQYLKDKELQSMVGICAKLVPGRVRLFLGRTIITYPIKYLDSHPKKKESFQLLAKEQEDNPLRFYAPTSGPVTDFINDVVHNFCCLFAPNRIGKTTANWIKKLLGCVKCDPSWEIFTEHGVNFREYDGFKNIGVYSYQMSNLEDTLWPLVIRKWTPKYLLGGYALGGNRTISWRGQPHIDTGEFEIWFKAASQSQGVFESQAVAEWLWDEQGVQSNFDGANERTRTVDGRHDVAATPHKIKGRPDTGANSWMCKMYRGEMTKGLNSAFYKASIEDVVDWVYPQKQKDAAYIQWVKEPTEQGNEQVLREGQARYYGEPHQSSGLVIDNFNRGIHLIDPFEIPESWTKFRAVDHGRVNPEAMLCMAVNPQGKKFLYQEYYKGGLDVSQNVKGIVEACGNELVPAGGMVNVSEGHAIRRMKEKFVKQKFSQSVLDSRSFAKTLETSKLTLGLYYRHCGLNCRPASGVAGEFSVPIVNDWFRVDYTREHPYTEKMGDSNIYVFRTLTNFIFEVLNWVYETHQTVNASESHNEKESPRKKDDHLMTCLLYLAGIPPRYIPGAAILDDDEGELEEDKQQRRKNIDKYTGY